MKVELRLDAFALASDECDGWSTVDGNRSNRDWGYAVADGNRIADWTKSVRAECRSPGRNAAL